MQACHRKVVELVVSERLALTLRALDLVRGWAFGIWDFTSAQRVNSESWGDDPESWGEDFESWGEDSGFMR